MCCALNDPFCSVGSSVEALVVGVVDRCDRHIPIFIMLSCVVCDSSMKRLLILAREGWAQYRGLSGPPGSSGWLAVGCGRCCKCALFFNILLTLHAENQEYEVRCSDR